MNQEFKPNYAVPPGETLKEILEEREWSVQDFSAISWIPISFIEGILNGDKSIEQDIANKIDKSTGISHNFWLNLQRNYDQTIKRLELEGKSLKREQGGRVSVIE
jgi:addiction module HigA family antidote